jgi:hypothetical protein
MTENGNKQELVRVSEDQLRKSRAGRLGRFPTEDLYDPEPSDEGTEGQQLRGTNQLSSKNEDPRKRSAAGGVE